MIFKHPSNVCMTYLTHFKLAIKISFLLLFASLKSLVHAFIPDIFITSTSDLIVDLNYLLKSAGCR